MSTPSHFEILNFDQVSAEPSGKPSELKSAHVEKTVVQEFELKNLKHSAAVRRTSPRAQAIAQAASGVATRGAHQDRFKLSQLAKEAQGEEAKEQRALHELIDQRVKAETEMARAIGIKEGYVEGLVQGKQEALDEYREKCRANVERLEQLMKAIELAKVQVFEANQKFVIDVAYHVGRSVLLKELATDKDYVLRLIRSLLEKTEIRDNLTLKLNPKDSALIDELKAGLLASFSGMKNLFVETSSEVHEGGAIVESEWGAIDASLETQLFNLQAALQSQAQIEG